MQENQKSPTHGLPVSRAKTGYAPGASPTPTVRTQIRQDKRAYYNPLAGETQIRDRLEAGRDKSPRGRRMAHDTGGAINGAVSLAFFHSGGKVTGGGIASKILRMVPMARFCREPGDRGLNSSFALCLPVAP